VNDPSGKEGPSERKSRLTEPSPPWLMAPAALCCSIVFFWFATKDLLSGQADIAEFLPVPQHLVHSGTEPGKFLLAVCLNLCGGLVSLSWARQQWRLWHELPDQAKKD
jgi:hypothetical protein